MEETANETQRRPKPLLTIDQQIAHLKAKGVTFNLCSEDEAADFLKVNNYLRTASYRKLFPVQVEGANVGKYVNLDFGHLKHLSSIDRRFREALVLATADIEHFAKESVIARAAAEGEDGYAIVADYLASLSHGDRNRITGSIRNRGAGGAGHDTYTGDLIAHYPDGLPVWVFLEVSEFGAFAGFYRYCAERWGDLEMLHQHYVLKSVKALRNAVSHGNCIVNGFTPADHADYPISGVISVSLNEAGMKNTKTRRAKLRNLRIAQIAATLYSVNAFCTRDATMTRQAERFAQLKRDTQALMPLFAANNSLVSFFDFTWKLVDIWVPYRAE